MAQASFSPEEVSRLLGEISHELRSPLSAAAIWFRLYEQAVDPAEKERCVRMLETNQNDFLHLAESLTDLANALAREKSGVMPTDLDRLLRDVLDGLREPAQRRQVTVELERREPGTVMVSVDPRQLTRALEEILGYALACREADSRLVVRLEADGDECRIVVPFRDSKGGGIRTLQDHLRQEPPHVDPSALAPAIGSEIFGLHGGGSRLVKGPEDEELVLRLPTVPAGRAVTSGDRG